MKWTLSIKSIFFSLNIVKNMKHIGFSLQIITIFVVLEKIYKMNNKIKYFFLVIGVLLFVDNSYAQLSMFNKVDLMKGLTTKVIPAGNKIVVFDTPQNAYDTVKFRMTKFDECRRLDWVKDFVIADAPGVTKLDAVTIKDIYIKDKEDIYILLKSPSYRLTLVKMKSSGDIYWAKTIHSTDGDNIYSEYSNILSNYSMNVLYIVSGYKSGNTSIFSMDLDGNILSSKIVSGFEHKSSVISANGNLIMFDKGTGYMSVALDDDIIGTLLWAKAIPDTLFFDELNDPVIELGDTSVITGVVDTISKQDTAIYRLVKFDKNGGIVKQTKGFFADDAGFYANNSLKFNEEDNKIIKPIYYMINKKVFFFNSNLEKGANPKIYKFNDGERYEVFSSSLEICDDESLVMSGFCYEFKENGDIDNESPYMFISKTQPGPKYKVEAETENCLPDSTAKEMINIEEFEIIDHVFSMDTIELIVDDVESRFKLIEGFEDDFCGKVIMDKEKRDTVELCPGEEYPFEAPTLKCSGMNFSWSTGESGEKYSSKIVSEAGEYSVTVTFCDSVRVHKLLYKYTDDVESCFKVYYPNAFFPEGKDTINTIFKMMIDTKYKEKDYDFTSFGMKIFNRWGEKVFETTDPEEGWDGTFRGSELPPGAYLYNINWKVDINGKKEYQGGKKGQIMLLK